MNLITNAVTRINFVLSLNRPMSIIWSTFGLNLSQAVVIRECVTSGTFLTASCKICSSFTCSDGEVSGHSFSDWYKKLGQFHHVLLAESSFADSPRDGRSAGFNSPGQCLHKSLGVRRRISSTLWPMYCFHTLSFLIQHRAVVESLQRTVVYSAPIDFNLLTSRAKINAPSNSNRGIVCALIGATLDFEATNLTSIRPSLYVFRI